MRVMVMGLDSLPWSMYRRFRDNLPHFRQLVEGGVSAPLTSTIPPITIPAWMCMMTGRDPGEHGLYGFRNRTGRDYQTSRTASSASFRGPAVWDVLSSRQKPSVLIGVPGTYPLRPFLGTAISDFLTPPDAAEYTYPAEFKETLKTIVDPYQFDITDYRSDRLADIQNEAFLMTDRRFQAISWMSQNVPWEFFMAVEIGLDRMHHVFWNHMDPDHPLFVPNSRYGQALFRYYKFLDTKLGEMLARLPDDVLLLVVSDHGTQGMAGGVFVNDWLHRQGYLHFKRPVHDERFQPELVDWAKTRAWAEGGYYARMYLNVEGREPEGVVPASRFEAERDALKEQLETLSCGARVFYPEEIYREVNGTAPDLLVYFGDLKWRALASVGHVEIYSKENDIGPDGANHAQEGVFIAYQPRRLGPGRLDSARLLDVANTVLSELGYPGEVPGSNILEGR